MGIVNTTEDSFSAGGRDRPCGGRSGTPGGCAGIIEPGA
jgi:hypothetical protein